MVMMKHSTNRGLFYKIEKKRNDERDDATTNYDQCQSQRPTTSTVLKKGLLYRDKLL